MNGKKLFIFILLGTQVWFARDSRAENVFETMGVSIAVGTVLGAASLPFYQQPGENLSNIAVGAGAGAVVGLGIVLFEAFSQSDEGVEKDYFYDSGFQPIDQSRRIRKVQPVREALGFYPKKNSLSSSQIALTLPVISLTW